MTHTIDNIKRKDTVATGEALVTIAEMCRKYNNVLNNIINIREKNPEFTADAFRKQASTIDKLHQINAILLKTLKLVTEHSREIILNYEAGLENYDCPKLNQSLIEQLHIITTDLTKIYANKSRSFTIILNEFELLDSLLGAKLDQDIFESDDPSNKMAYPCINNKTDKSALNASQRHAYVRLFHRNMANLLSPSATLNWMKPLLESVKNAEKHGLTVYDSEEYARRSLRGENYGYLTIHLNDTQDITHQRPQRHDPQLNCPLLTIQNITIEDFVKFSFGGHDFPIREGILYRPKSILDKKDN